MTTWLKTDEFTYALGITAAALYALSKFLGPTSLLPPLLLGRQSDVNRTRQSGESAIYRNYGTGFMGHVNSYAGLDSRSLHLQLPVRPDKGTLTVNDLVKADFTEARYLWGERVSPKHTSTVHSKCSPPLPGTECRAAGSGG